MITTKTRKNEDELTEIIIKTKARGDDLSDIVMGAAGEVHRLLGPGLPADTYREALSMELTRAGVPHECGREVPLRYRGAGLRCPLRCDLVVDGILVVGISVLAAHDPDAIVRLQRCLELTSRRIGLSLSFGAIDFREGDHNVLTPHPDTPTATPLRRPNASGRD